MRQRLKTELVIFAYFTAIGLLFFGYRYLETVASREHVSPIGPLINEMTGAWLAALLFPFVARFARRFPIQRPHTMARVSQHALALLAYSATHTSLQWGLRTTLYPLFGLRPYDYGIMTARYPMEFFHDALTYVLMVAILYLFDRHVRAAQLEGKLAQARLHNLRLQLQPHFLFNALNTISSILYEDPRRADAMIARLSSLLRATITDSEAQIVPLEREIETLELYLDIMRQRFEDKLSVDVRISPDVRTALVPHLILQPLVENSIRHGITPVSNSVRVTVTAERNGQNTVLCVRDRGRGLPDGKMKKGTGLSNTIERLQQLYAGSHTLAFENLRDGGLAVTVGVPYST